MNATLEKPTPARADTSVTVVEQQEQPPTITAEPMPPVPSTLPLAAAPTIIVEYDNDKNTPTSSSTNPGKSAASAIVPRDGGPKAWIVVLGSFLIHSFAFAPTEYIFGVFELHYQTIYPDAAASSIAFIGSTGSAVTYLAGFLSGIVADRFGFRITALAGTFVMSLSLVLASFANQLWQLYLTQGILFGIGASLAYYPAIAAPSHYFNKKRGLATGIAVSGVGAGGLVLAPLTHSLIDSLDIYWTLRVLALLCLCFCGTASVFIVESKDHLEIDQLVSEKNTSAVQSQDQEVEVPNDAAQKKPSFFAALKVFKDARFLSLSLAELTASFAFLVPLYFMQTYAVFIGVSAEKGALILGLSNGASFAGRILLGLTSDYISNAKVLLLCAWCAAFAVMVLWTVSRSFGTLLLMGLIFGFFAGGYVSLVPVAISQSFGTKQMASTMGLMYTAGGLGMLGGAPLAGVLLDMTKPNVSYLPVTMVAGSLMTLGALCVTTWAYLDWKAKRVRRVTTMDTL